MLTIFESEMTHSKMASSVIPVHVRRSHKWLDNRTEEYEVSNITARSNELFYSENNANHSHIWRLITVNKKRFFVELICFTQSERCSNATDW